MLYFENIGTPSYILSKGIKLFENLSFEINSGDKVLLQGDSGTGKTTLLNIISLIEMDFSGKYFINDIDTKTLGQNKRGKLRNSTFGYIFQDQKLIESDNVLDNIRLPLDYSSKKTVDKKQRIEEILAFVDLLDRKKEKVRNLSGGEKQRVAIARALINRPKILIADEAFTSIHKSAYKEMMVYIEKYLSNDKIFIMTSHIENQIPSFINKVIELG